MLAVFVIGIAFGAAVGIAVGAVLVAGGDPRRACDPEPIEPDDTGFLSEGGER